MNFHIAQYGKVFRCERTVMDLECSIALCLLIVNTSLMLDKQRNEVAK